MARFLFSIIFYFSCSFLSARVMLSPDVGSKDACIFYESGWEEIILEEFLNQKAGKFSMILPFPEIPVIRGINRDYFRQMKNYFQVINREFKKKWPGVDTKVPFKEKRKKMVPLRPELAIIKKEMIAGFEVLTLKATSVSSLMTWLEKEGSNLTSAAKKVFSRYVEMGWFFVVVKRNSNKILDKIRLLSFRFKSQKPFFPASFYFISPGPNLTLSLFTNTRGKVHIFRREDKNKNEPFFKERSTPHRPDTSFKKRLPPHPNPYSYRKRTAELEYSLLLKFPVLLKVCNRQVLENAPEDFKREYQKWMEEGEYLKMDRARIALLEKRHLTSFQKIFSYHLPFNGEISLEISPSDFIPPPLPPPPNPRNIAGLVAEILKNPIKSRREKLFELLQTKDLSSLKILRNDPDYRKRKILAKALAMKGDRKSFIFLVSWLSTEEDWTVKDEICASLQKLSGRNYRSYEIELWQKWLKSNFAKD
ncbi:DUF2330 domain-containing protein [Candidatus Riflebacteria bacterium]